MNTNNQNFNQTQQTTNQNYTQPEINVNSEYHTEANNNEPIITDENKVVCALSYIPILSWIMYLTKKDDKAVVRAANQGLILLIGIVAISILTAIFSFHGAIWTLMRMVLSLCNTALGVCGLIGLIKAAQKEYFEIPIIGGFKIFK